MFKNVSNFLVQFIVRLLRASKKILNSLFQFLKSSKKTILLIVTVSIITLIVSSLISMKLSRFNNMRFSTLGNIQVIGVEVYGGNITIAQNGAPLLDWGTLYPGYAVNCSFYIKSKSNTAVTLNLSISNMTFINSKGENVTWAMPITKPLSLTWNYNNALLNPGEAVYITLTLKASSDNSFLEYVVNNEVNGFSFDIIITASPQH